MGCFEITPGMEYSPETDLWTDAQGSLFVKNEFEPENPNWLGISSSFWSISHQGSSHYIQWDSIAIPEGLLVPIKTATMHKMKICSPHYLGMTRSALANLQQLVCSKWKDFSDIDTSDMAIIWQGLNERYRVYFRELYRTMVDLGIGGARSDILFEMKHWKARNELLFLRDVLQWHVTKGALTSSEEKVLRSTLSTEGVGYESDKEHAIRIFGWLLLDTLKRPSQVLDIRKNGVREVPNAKGKSDWFVEIKPIKAQAGLPLRWWRISEELAQEINSYNKRQRVAELQERFDRLIVWDVPSLFGHGVVSGTDTNAALVRYIWKRGVISPRTGNRLHITATRIRHTGATRLAFQGVSRDLIQEILEHDSSESAQAYIDAIGSEIIPAIEKAGRLMGNIFYELNKGFFTGRIVKNIADKPPVIVPEFAPAPIIVGTCGRDTLKDGVCPKHPFLSCYDGCSCFFAWDNPDPHGKALRYFEKEIILWEKSIEAAEQKSTPHFIADKTLLTYQRAADAVKEVMAQISKVSKGGGDQ